MVNLIEERGASVRPPRTHRNEFPAEYSLAGCSPAEPTSASSADFILHKWIPFVKKISANGSCRIYSVSHERAQWNPNSSIYPFIQAYRNASDSGLMHPRH